LNNVKKSVSTFGKKRRSSRDNSFFNINVGKFLVFDVVGKSKDQKVKVNGGSIYDLKINSTKVIGFIDFCRLLVGSHRIQARIQRKRFLIN
jgi:hypothetical protein